MEVFLATHQAINNNEFLGLGSSSPSFVTSTIVLHQNAIITRLTFNIRDHVLNTGIITTAELSKRKSTIHTYI